MKKETELAVIENLTKKIRGAKKISKLAGDASSREYFRVFTGEDTLVAMVYMENNPEEIGRIENLTKIYMEAGIRVPEIVDQIGDNILLQEDVGDISIQNYLSNASEKNYLKIRDDIGSILKKIKNIKASNTDFELDLRKMKFEIDFFIDNFVLSFSPDWGSHQALREEILENLDKISGKRIFAHRDFHSRNIFVKDENYYLIDFQDSLLAPEFYDSVSFVFDPYLQPGSTQFFLPIFEKKSEKEMEQIYLTAYQRGIKALGTFGYQYFAGNRKFYRYIQPTINNLRKNICFSEGSRLDLLFKSVEKRNHI